MNQNQNEQIQVFTGSSPKITALQFLIGMRPYVPMSVEKPNTVPSNSELRRWLQQKSVCVNGATPQPDDLIELPVKQLQYFPKSAKRRTTYF